ncbi:hypothetical protein CesoFtcFv8_000467 [Champsocephalus esox]|uniref:Uncharacterized protein n=1 Tax=Champsocephalus esox TaxID=159716 RepID=A0AAN8D2U1_9TELE|nr:hypothetical protein CesoFtcFv8_000467 [Champsocephalus esox]
MDTTLIKSSNMRDRTLLDLDLDPAVCPWRVNSLSLNLWILRFSIMIVQGSTMRDQPLLELDPAVCQ